MIVEERRRRLAGPHRRMVDEPAEEAEVRRHAGDPRRAQRARERRRTPPRASRRGRSAWRSAGRRRAATSSPASTPASTRTVLRQLGGSSRPGLGEERQRVLGVQAHLDRVAVGLARAAASGSPAAIRSCCSTRSIPVTSSVTGCSTWSRAFSSRN